jgi:hypothetical protein
LPCISRAYRRKHQKIMNSNGAFKRIHINFVEKGLLKAYTSSIELHTFR